MSQYIIWSQEHRGWWNPERLGYTQDITKAGRYPLVDAIDICRVANHNLPDGQVEEYAILAPEKLQTILDGASAITSKLLRNFNQ